MSEKTVKRRVYMRTWWRINKRGKHVVHRRTLVDAITGKDLFPKSRIKSYAEIITIADRTPNWELAVDPTGGYRTYVWPDKKQKEAPE